MSRESRAFAGGLSGTLQGVNSQDALGVTSGPEVMRGVRGRAKGDARLSCHVSLREEDLPGVVPETIAKVCV